MEDIDKYRKAIDGIDNQILTLLNQRMGLVKEIGRAKQTSGTAIYRPEREREILDRLKSLNQGALNNQAIDAIFLEVFAVSRNLEFPEKIAYLGPEGSYTHQVAESRFGAMGGYIAVSSIEAVFHALENKEAKYGVVPVENSTEGGVVRSLDLFLHTPLAIVGETSLLVRHNLLRRTDSIDGISAVLAHPQALNHSHADALCILLQPFVIEVGQRLANQLVCDQREAGNR